MPIVRMHNIGSMGVIKDIPDHALPPEVFSDSLNVRFVDGNIEKIGGVEDVFNLSMSGSLTVSQSIAESPWAVFPVQADSTYYWLYAGRNNVHIATANKNSENINKLDTTASATFVYSATPTLRWNGDQLAGLPVLNNGVNSPQVWATPGTGNRLQDMQWDISASVSGTSSASGAVGPTSWATRTAGAVSCVVFRTYREFGIAMNTTEGGTQHPRRLRWSHPAADGTQPTSWEDTRTDKDASYHDYDDTPGFITDGRQLRDMFIVYKEDSTHVMQWTGGRLVMAHRPLFQTVSAISHDCAQDFYGSHIVLTKDRDVIVHDAQNPRSILQGKWKNYLYNQVDENYEKNCFVAIDLKNTEALICYPESGTNVANWCTHALVWNWRDDTLYVRELKRASHIAAGVILGPGDGALTWDIITDLWSNTTLTWDQQSYQVAGAQLLMAKPADTASASSVAKLLKMNSTEQFDGINMTQYFERTSLPIAGSDSRGRPVVNSQEIKYVTSVWPLFEAPDGVTFDIYIGSQMRLSDSVTWKGPYTFTQGSSDKIDCRVTGRFISFRISTNIAFHWQFTGYDLELDLTGRF